MQEEFSFAALLNGKGWKKTRRVDIAAAKPQIKQPLT